jgi:hypothetical protein
MSFLKIKLLVMAAVIFAASSAFADYSYLVTVNTSSLVSSNPTGYLYMDFMPGTIAPSAATATVSNFTTDGTLGTQDFTNLYNGSAVTGTLASSVVFANTNQNNDYNQAITFGNSLSFDVLVHGTTSALPDAAAYFSLILNQDAGGTQPLLTSDGVAFTTTLNNDGTQSFTASAQTDATPTPIPAAAWLLGSGIMGLAGIRRRKNA